MKHADGERFLRALRETLDTVVTPIVRDALIHDALILSGQLSLPTERAAMIEFAKGPLRTVTERALGVELADSVADEIARMTETARVTSAPPPPHMRRSTPAPRTTRAVPGNRKAGPPTSTGKRSDTLPGHRPPTTPPPPRPESSERHPTLTPVPRAPRRRPAGPNLSPWPSGIGSHIRRPADTEAPSPSARGYAEQAGISGSALAAPRTAEVREPPCVFVATEDASLFSTLAEWFADRAVIIQVHGVLDLVRHLDAAEERRAIVVLDGRAPSIRPQALAVLIEELSNVDVMMCRAAPALEQVVLAASQASARWLVYREPASLDHIAAECLRLVS